jgi:anti-sigma factor (TIGR02949 family)
MQTSLPPSPASLEVLSMPKQKCDHSADCLKMVQLILDGEATEEQVNQFRNNLDTCRPCFEMYHLEKEVKQMLQGRMEKRSCPDQLINAIKSRILSFS